MSIKKLIVEEFELDESTPQWPKPGYKYSYFKDPETGKYYRPKTTFMVTGDKLETMFEEVETE